MVAAVAAILYDASGTRIGSGVLFPSVINDIEFAASTWLSESSSDIRWRKKKTKNVDAYIANKPRRSSKI